MRKVYEYHSTDGDAHVPQVANALMPASPALPSGAQQSVLVGDPSKEGAYVARLKFPAGYKVPAHHAPH